MNPVPVMLNHRFDPWAPVAGLSEIFQAVTVNVLVAVVPHAVLVALNVPRPAGAPFGINTVHTNPPPVAVIV